MARWKGRRKRTNFKR